MIITTGKAAQLTGGKLYGHGDLIISELVTDSRQTVVNNGAAFFAIKGRNHDGHSFTEQLYQRGVRIFFIEDIPADLSHFEGSAIIVVQNTIKALQQLAAEKRRHFSGIVIAITGSTGKTVVKEWLADMTGSVMPVVRSPKSYNSQIGVPLSVWKLENKFEVGIIEAGISKAGEMEKLARIIKPDIGVITNIGDAHNENFSSLREKAAEKLKLFREASVIVYCHDQEIIRELIINDQNFTSKKLVDWSFNNRNSVVFVEKVKEPAGITGVKISYAGTVFDASIPFSDKASIENAVTAAAAGLATGIKPEIVRNGISKLVSVAMRMEIKAGINGCILIEDYYNSDPGSLKMALEYLKSQNNPRTVLILSDFMQTGRDEKSLYGEVADLINSVKIDRFIGIGTGLSGNRNLFPPGSRFFESTRAFCSEIDTSDFSEETILLKGARSFEFEKISNLLSYKIHQTILEINLDAISHNINEIRKRLNPGTKIMAMVKAFAYGAGPSEIASLMTFHRIDYLAVACADEGVQLREAGVSLPVVVMNPEPDAFDLMIKYNLEPEIYSLNLLRKFSGAAIRHGLADYPVHIKVDTGMHRLGFILSEVDEMIKELTACRCLKIASVFSHLAASEDPASDHFTHQQVSLLIEVAGKIRESLGNGFLIHILNTAGIIRFPEYQFDMVRPGIGIYGIASVPGINLKQAGRFRTRIMQVKTVPPGEPVGYGCADVSDRQRRIAVMPVGYADGLDRKLSNGKGRFFINDRYAPVVGQICMDICMADITGIDANEGDEVEIFGEHISVEEIARLTNTIPYEILTSIPTRVKRIFFRE
ncbi:MAG: bifunctional UDP-N-acetylmuramoyl-tripeptide:D-alanyl-D-alanine ligase/alanine racemase [Bacteroidales bacterium]